MGGGWRQQERYVKSNLQKTSSVVVVESLDAPPERTNLHPARYLDTSEKVTWITFSCLSLTNVAKIQSGRCRLTSESTLMG